MPIEDYYKTIDKLEKFSAWCQKNYMKKSLLCVAYIKCYEKHKEIKTQIDKKLVEKKSKITRLAQLNWDITKKVDLL